MNVLYLDPSLFYYGPSFSPLSLIASVKQHTNLSYAYDPNLIHQGEIVITYKFSMQLLGAKRCLLKLLIASH